MPESAPLAAALAGMIAFGIGDFLGGRAAARLGTTRAVLLVQGVGAGLLGLLVMLAGARLPEGAVLVQAAVAGLAYTGGQLALLRGLAVGQTGIVAPVEGLSAVALPALGELLLLGHASSASLPGIALAGLATVMIGLGDRRTGGLTPCCRSLRLGLLAGASFGLAYLLMGGLAPETALPALLAMRITAALAALAAWLATRGGPDAPTAPWGCQAGLAIALWAGLLDLCGTLGFVQAATRAEGLIGPAAAVLSLHSGITLLLGVVVLRERLLPVQLAGLAVGLASVVVMTP